LRCFLTESKIHNLQEANTLKIEQEAPLESQPKRRKISETVDLTELDDDD
jgi:hypothetical protein